jgi:thiosulfate sulfurtransferase
MIKRISVIEAAELINNQAAIVIDIRDVNSFNQSHIQEAIRVDNSNIQQFIAQADKSKPLVVCCYHGNSSQSAAELFNQQGFEVSCSLDGGMSEWSLTMPVVAS